MGGVDAIVRGVRGFRGRARAADGRTVASRVVRARDPQSLRRDLALDELVATPGDVLDQDVWPDTRPFEPGEHDARSFCIDESLHNHRHARDHREAAFPGVTKRPRGQGGRPDPKDRRLEAVKVADGDRVEDAGEGMRRRILRGGRGADDQARSTLLQAHLTHLVEHLGHDLFGNASLDEASMDGCAQEEGCRLDLLSPAHAGGPGADEGIRKCFHVAAEPEAGKGRVVGGDRQREPGRHAIAERDEPR